MVFDEDGVRVSAFTVDHGEFLKPAVGYRVDYRGRSVVISGDTRASENLVRHSTNVDLIVHEVAMWTAEARAAPATAYVLAHHTSPTEAATVFSRARPTLAVLTHIALPPTVTGRGATAADALSEARRAYAGSLELGEDLMRIVVHDTVLVRSPSGIERRVTR